MESNRCSNLVDILDRVLDKGIVTDASIRVSLAGIHLLTVEAFFVIASIQTHMHYAAELGDPSRTLAGSLHSLLPPVAR